MKPRLAQPLFSGATAPARIDARLYHLVRAYDVIWSLLYEPLDLTRESVVHNANANLQVLGDLIERSCGEEAFEDSPKQLSFPDEILDCAQTNSKGQYRPDNQGEDE